MALALTAKPGAMGFALLTPHVALANPFVVACNDIDTPTTGLRAAIAAGGTVTLTANCVYHLVDAGSADDGIAAITNTVVIEGNGATITRDDGPAQTPNAAFRILHVQGAGNLTIDHLTVSNGKIVSSESGGAGIYNDGATLVVVSSNIIGNKVSNSFVAKGGGILSAGDTTVTDSVISGNEATTTSNSTQPYGLHSGGGGIAAKGGRLKVQNTTIKQNTVSSTMNLSATPLVRSNAALDPRLAALAAAHPNTVLDSDLGTNSLGGGILVAGDPGLLSSLTGPVTTVTGSTISANSVSASSPPTGAATAAGGGIGQADFSTLFSNQVPDTVVDTTVINTTIASNTLAAAGATAVTDGGGIGIYGGSNDKILVVNATIAENSGGVAAQGTGTTTLVNTLLSSHNSTQNCTGSGTITDAGHNISFPNATATCDDGFAHGDPVLDSLAANGGLTMTMALGAGSSAIDTADNPRCLNLTTDAAPGAGGIDQRGFPRNTLPLNTICDVGAYEAQKVGVATPIASVAPAVVTLPKAGSPARGDGSPVALVIAAALGAGGAVAGLRSRRRRQPH